MVLLKIFSQRRRRWAKFWTLWHVSSYLAEVSLRLSSCWLAEQQRPGSPVSPSVWLLKGILRNKGTCITRLQKVFWFTKDRYLLEFVDQALHYCNVFKCYLPDTKVRERFIRLSITWQFSHQVSYQRYGRYRATIIWKHFSTKLLRWCNEMKPLRCYFWDMRHSFDN